MSFPRAAPVHPESMPTTISRSPGERQRSEQAQTMLTIQEEGSGNPSEKPDDPSEKPDDPSEKPENPSEKPDDPSDETGQEPTKDSSQNQTQNPAQKPSQSQENPENSPKTGDNMPVVWLIVLAALSAAGLAAGKCRRQ